tara:strand:- start:381 stop:569 length:189 start_codon:yes stop_codon:yes gene_type:complete
MKNSLLTTAFIIISTFFNLSFLSVEAGSCRIHKNKNFENKCSINDKDCLKKVEQKKLKRASS